MKPNELLSNWLTTELRSQNWTHFRKPRQIVLLPGRRLRVSVLFLFRSRWTETICEVEKRFNERFVHLIFTGPSVGHELIEQNFPLRGIVDEV